MKKVILVNWGTKDKRYVFEAARSKKIKLYLATSDNYPEWIGEFVPREQMIITNTYDPVKLVDDVLEYCRKLSIKFDGVTTFFEMNIRQAAILAESLGLKFLSVESANQSSQNKWLMRKKCEEMGIVMPKFAKFTNVEEGFEKLKMFKLPVVIKPVMSGHSYGVQKVSKQEEFGTAYDQARKQLAANFDEWMKFYGVFYSDDFLIEEYVEGQLVSVDGIIQDGKEKFVGMAQFEMGKEPCFLEVVTYIPAWISNRESLRCILKAREIYKALGFDNCGFHCEMRIDNTRGPMLMEIAGRLPGGQMLEGYQIAFGVDLAKMIFDVCLGRKVAKFKGKVKKYVVQESISFEREGVVKKLVGLERLSCENIKIYQQSKPGEQVKSYGGIFTPYLYYSAWAKTKKELKVIMLKVRRVRPVFKRSVFVFADDSNSVIVRIYRKLVGFFNLSP